jgi:hypothetical protein
MTSANTATAATPSNSKGAKGRTPGSEKPASATERAGARASQGEGKVPTPSVPHENPAQAPAGTPPGTSEGGSNPSKGKGKGGGKGTAPATPTTADGKVPKHLKTRIYVVHGLDRDKPTYVKANSKAKAILYVAMAVFSGHTATGEELFEAGKTQAEIHDASGMVVSDTE